MIKYVTSYSNLYSLSELIFIGGTKKVLTFATYKEDGTLLNINSGLASWVLSPVGSPEIHILEKEGMIIDDNHFMVTLDISDTIDLKGRYIQQPILTDFTNNSFRKQGNVVISPAIPTT
jgi:hypothetical protein